jgi:hypothetical protein
MAPDTTLSAPKRPRNGKAKPASLVTKLAEVQAAISSVDKTGYNDFQKYSYAEEAEIMSACRAELAKRQIMIIPSIERVTHEGTLTTIETSYTFVDGETGDQFVTKWAGTGSDKQDKGLYKAITGSQKYVLLKTFLIPTGENGVADDPEQPAREVVEETPRTPPPAPTGTTHPDKLYVTKYRVAKQGEKDGNAWTLYALEFSDGRNGSTFDDGMADRADHANANNLAVTTTIEQRGKYPTVVELELAPDGGA